MCLRLLVSAHIIPQVRESPAWAHKAFPMCAACATQHEETAEIQRKASAGGHNTRPRLLPESTHPPTNLLGSC